MVLNHLSHRQKAHSISIIVFLLLYTAFHWVSGIEYNVDWLLFEDFEMYPKWYFTEGGCFLQSCILTALLYNSTKNYYLRGLYLIAFIGAMIVFFVYWGWRHSVSIEFIYGFIGLIIVSLLYNLRRA